MLRYNKEENMIYAFKNEFHEPIPEDYPISPDKVSYDDYFDNGIYTDIKELLVPTLRKMCGLKEDDTSELYVDGITREIHTDYKKQSLMYYKVRFGSYKSGGESEYVTVFKIPIMDRFGVLSKEGRDYSVIKLLEQDEVISYEPTKRKLKIKFPRGDFSVKAGSKEPIINISRFKQTSGQKNFSALNTMFALCELDGVDAVKLFKQFTNSQLSNRYNNHSCNDDKLLDAVEYLGGNVGSINASDYFDMVIPALKSEQYDLTTIRDSLNRFLSLDRALGKILDEPVKVSAGYEIPAGTTITQNVINVLKSDKVNCIHVKSVPVMLGYYTAEIITIPILKRGTRITESIRKFVPNETGLYVSSTLDLRDNPIVIMDGTLVTEGFMEMLAYNEFPDVSLSQKVNDSKPPLKVSFRYDIITNNHHMVDGEWIYVDDKGNELPMQQYFTAHDIAALLSVTQRLFIGQDWGTVQNSDIGFRKRIVMPGELFKRAFEQAVKTFGKTMRFTFRELWNSNNVINLFSDDAISNQFYGITAEWWRTLQKTYRCVELLDVDDKTNPVSYISALTKIVSFVKDKNSIGRSMRDIALTQYGKIDPYESPQSRKLGVVNNLALGVVIKGDTLYTRYRRVVHVGENSYITDEVVEMCAEEEEKCIIADIGSLTVAPDGRITNSNSVLCRVPEYGTISKQTVNYVGVGSVDCVNCTPNQFISWATATIAFMGSNDAVRVNFGVAQTKAAKGLVNSEVPRVITSANKIIPRLNTNYCIFAEKNGEVFDLTHESVILLYDGDAQVTEYYFKSVESALYSCTVRTPVVDIGQRVSKGDILMTSNFVKNGILAMGVNALTAYIPNGYNYEDGNSATTRLCNKLTSYRTNHGTWENEERFSSVRFSDIHHLGWCSPNSPLFKIMGYKGSKDGQERNVYPEKVKGFLHEVEIERDKTARGRQYVKGINYTTISIDSVSTGDKFTNRHGNKGVVPQKVVRVNGNDGDMEATVINNSEALRLRNGEFIDLAYNPLGVVSRMNDGQIKEINCGLALHVIDSYLQTDSFNCISPEEIDTLMSYAYDLANEEDCESVFPKYPNLDSSLHEHCRERIHHIHMWKGVFDRQGCAYLINPKNGMKETETKVLIGIETVYKLIQESDKKIHVRGGMASGEPYLEINNAPTKSAANNGGQKFGTMEMDALCAYGASSYMWELQNLRGDNGILRNNWNAEVLHEGDGYNIPDNNAYRRSTVRFMTTMMALGVSLEASKGELPKITKETLSGFYTYTKTALLTARDTYNPGFGWQKKRNETVDEVTVENPKEEPGKKLSDSLDNLKNMFRRE